jgi:hypothetical protein
MTYEHWGGDSARPVADSDMVVTVGIRMIVAVLPSLTVGTKSPGLT